MVRGGGKGERERVVMEGEGRVREGERKGEREW